MKHHNRNTFYQKQIADRIDAQAIKTLEILTSAISIHLNKEQNMTMNSSSAFMIMKTSTYRSLFNTSIEHIENTRIHLPENFSSNITNNTIISVRVCFNSIIIKIQSELLSLKIF